MSTVPEDARSAIAAILGVAVLFLLVLCNFTRISTWLRGPDAALLPVLTQAPDFTWDTRHLRDSSGPEGQVLLFVSSTCPCSNVYADRCIALMRQHGSRFHFLWINEDKVRLLDRHPTEPLQKALVRVQQAGLPVDTLFDTHDAIAHQYGVRVTPEVFVLDAHGFIRYHGRIDDNQDAVKVQNHELQDALDALEAGRDVAVKETKAIGCYVLDDL